MTSNVASRATIRTEFARLLTAKLVTLEGSAAAVFAYQVGDFDDVSPVVVVASAGSQRSMLTRDTVSHNTMFLDVHIFVAYTMKNDSGVVVFTEEDSEDRLDLLEKQIFDVVIDNFVHLPYWTAIKEESKSVIGVHPIGGEEFRHEIIPLQFRKPGA